MSNNCVSKGCVTFIHMNLNQRKSLVKLITFERKCLPQLRYYRNKENWSSGKKKVEKVNDKKKDNSLWEGIKKREMESRNFLLSHC